MRMSSSSNNNNNNNILKSCENCSSNMLNGRSLDSRSWKS